MHAEIQRSFQQLKGSYLDDSNSGLGALSLGLGGDHCQSQLMTILNRKVDHMDFHNMLGTKTNKKETSMMQEQINILHKQIESLASVIQQQVRMKLDAHLVESKN